MGRPKTLYTVDDYKDMYFDKVQQQENGCYLWTAAKNNIGYGMFRYFGKMRTTHRIMAEWEGFDIKNKDVYHTCGVYNCVNPQHLLVGSKRDRTQMMLKRGNAGRGMLGKKHKLVHCVHCNRDIPAPTYGLHHGDRCQSKKP